ncbi:MAG: hypothetical protein JOY75_03635 [Hyphomicrobiales bacterium]|nr:hypothetical protein [Hyphomicrobiales bacterium]
MLAIGLAPLALVLFLLRRRYLGRPNALREMFFASIGMISVVPFLAFAVLCAANVALDDSPAQNHRVRVLDSYKHNSHTVYVESWTAGVAREKIIVPRSIVSLRQQCVTRRADLLRASRCALRRAGDKCVIATRRATLRRGVVGGGARASVRSSTAASPPARRRRPCSS